MAAVKRAESTTESLLSDDSAFMLLDSLEQKENYELQNLLAEVLMLNEAQEKENRMFEKFLKRLDPKDVQSKAIPAVGSSQLDLQKRKTFQRRGVYTSERLLSMEQKCNIATRELDELQEEIYKEEEETERNYDNLRAVVAEADARLTELKKATYEFDRDVLRGAFNPRTGRIMGEKVVRYFEDKRKSRKALAEKLRLKNATFRVKRKKLQIQLKQKEETGEVCHEVDFQQLKIENKQLTERCDEKNQELLKLKLRAADTLQILNTYKKKLHGLILESRAIDAEISQRTELQAKVEAETNVVIKEKTKAEHVNRESRKKLENYRVPEVVEYVQERASLYELTKSVRAWERKVEIAEMALRTYKQTWKRLCSQHKYSMSLTAPDYYTTTPASIM